MWGVLQYIYAFGRWAPADARVFACTARGSGLDAVIASRPAAVAGKEVLMHLGSFAFQELKDKARELGIAVKGQRRYQITVALTDYMRRKGLNVLEM
jgi:hypothetical protein